MERQDELPEVPAPAPPAEPKQAYEPPRVESVRLTREAAEALT
jgi:hypothetical protein